jgi:hypothetical protein
VQPLLARRCHGPDVQQSGLRFDKRRNAMRGSDYGPVIIPGKRAESRLIRCVVNGDEDFQNGCRRIVAYENTLHPGSASFRQRIPYAHDQWISSAGAAWASTALSMMVETPAISRK